MTSCIENMFDGKKREINRIWQSLSWRARIIWILAVLIIAGIITSNMLSKFETNRLIRIEQAKVESARREAREAQSRIEELESQLAEAKEQLIILEERKNARQEQFNKVRRRTNRARADYNRVRREPIEHDPTAEELCEKLEKLGYPCK